MTKHDRCDDQAVAALLVGIGIADGGNKSDIGQNCENYNSTFTATDGGLLGGVNHTGSDHPDMGQRLYAYVTPIIIIIGLIGNSISLKVFLSRNLNRLSASLYLAALSASDTLVLLTYVLLDWLHKGLPYWPGNKHPNVINYEGVCHLFLFSSYTFRFVSVWLIVVFTIERYIAVCRPLERRIICTRTIAKRIIAGVTLAGALVGLYKPITSGLYAPRKTDNIEINGHVLPVNGVSLADEFGDLAPSQPTAELDFGNQKICTRNPEYYHFNFVMDILYGLIITAVPFIVITVFNMIIMNKLVNRDTFRGQVTLRFKEKRVRLEFTITLLVVSSCFICLNFPYFVVFCQQFVQSNDPSGDFDEPMRARNNIFITKTIFNINYSINFFLYCVTGTYYRGAIKAMFLCKDKDAFSPVPMRKASTSTSLQTTQMKELSYV